jgi:hypothetical protein
MTRSSSSVVIAREFLPRNYVHIGRRNTAVGLAASTV